MRAVVLRCLCGPLPANRFAGTGEARCARAFHPERVAGRILGMGDVVSLVRRAAESVPGRRRRADGRQDSRVSSA